VREVFAFSENSPRPIVGLCGRFLEAAVQAGVVCGYTAGGLEGFLVLRVSHTDVVFCVGLVLGFAFVVLPQPDHLDSQQVQVVLHFPRALAPLLWHSASGF
jgi:hypothetical protein